MINKSPKITESIENQSINITIPTSQEEMERIITYISRIPFYRENGYKIDNLVLPRHSIFQEFIDSPEKVGVLKTDKILFEKLLEIFSKEEFLEVPFSIFKQELESKMSYIQEWIEKLKNLGSYFKKFSSYQINMTLYGMWWSYDYRDGSVTVRYWKSNWPKPKENTILHEIIHIGIEESIVQRFRLTQREKERVVDLMGKYLLGDDFLQSIGDKRIDEFVNATTIHDIPEAISKYIQKYPR